MKTPAAAASRSAIGRSSRCGIRDWYANRTVGEHAIIQNRLIWTAIAGLILGLVLQVVGCTTPEERHRILTIFFDGVPPLNPAEPEPLLEEPEGGNAPQIARAVVVNPDASVHGPVAEKECDQCHSSRYSNRLKLERPELCWSCHDREDFAGAVVHGPFAAGFCQGCHDPHRSQYAYLLVSDEKDLCLSCHERYDLADIADHRSDEGRLCQSCHDPHASDRQYMLKSDEDSP